jgi:hypothetical protein
MEVEERGKTIGVHHFIISPFEELSKVENNERLTNEKKSTEKSINIDDS